MKSFIGTTLERPSLLYKKKFFKDTYFSNPGKPVEANYQNVNKGRQELFNNQMSNKNKFNSSYNSKIYPISLESRLGNSYDDSVDGYLNFLDTPPFILPNLKETDGVFSFNLNSNLYTNL